MTSRSALLVVLVLGCDGTPELDAGPPPDAGPSYAAHCENVNPVDCLLPWPSSFFLEGEGAARRIAIDEAAMPANRRGVVFDPEVFARFDGFSPMTQIVTSFAGPVDGSRLHGETQIAETLSPTSSTVLLDAETGQLVAHYAELDRWPSTDPERAPLYIRPAARLAEDRRYIVAVQGLALEGGAPLEAAPYFAALRDGTPLPEAPDLEARRAHFEEIFTALEAAGVARGALLEAWDYRTASGDSLHGDLLAMRDDALDRVGADGLGCTVSEVREGADVDPDVHRFVRGTFTVPLYLESADARRLRRGADGRPVADGTFEVPFTALIPESVRARVAAGGPPARFLTYGHGLVSSQAEIETSWHIAHASQLEMVSFATDWIGLSEDDLAPVVLALQDNSSFPDIPERLHQGIINTLVLTRSFRGTCAGLPELAVDLDAGGTAPAYDPSVPYYYGNSMGGVLGTTLAALSTDIDRFVLGVNGVSFPTFIKRSTQWSTYGEIARMGYRDPLVADLIVAMNANLWELVESATYAPHVLADPLPGSSPKRVLMMIGRYDDVLANVTSDMQARTMGLPILTPSPYVPYGVEEATAPVDSAMVVYDFNVEALPEGSGDPTRETGTHEDVRRAPRALEQMDRFFAPDGRVEAVCSGPCDPD